MNIRVLVIGFLLGMAGCNQEVSEEYQAVGLESDVELSSVDVTAALVARAGAPIFSGLGDFHLTITTNDPGAQRYFDQGMVLAFAFNHAEAIRSFRAAQTLDPSCAMCFWGEALATGPNINVTSNGKAVMSSADRLSAYAAIGKALSLRANITQLEQDYISAQASRYDGDISSDRQTLDSAYANAMEALSLKYPDDANISSMFAEALMNTMPWSYWTDEGEPKPDTAKVIAQLERVLDTEPDHPLALHLYIHAVEASANPGRAEAAADRLANLVPAAGHLVHMPAHIYWRVGRYHDASAANIRAAQVDEDYIAQCNAQGFYPALYYPHNIHFLWAASTMGGRSELSIDAAKRVARNVSIEQIEQFPTIEFFQTIPLLSYVRFGRWDEIENTPEPPANLVYSRGIWHYAQGLRLSHEGDVVTAKVHLEAMRPLTESVSVTFLDSREYPASLLLSIATDLLQGEIAESDNRLSDAIDFYQRAVSQQDSLPYTEPPFWYYPTRQSLGNALMRANRFDDASAVFLQDLQDYPHNGWSLFGLARSLEQAGKMAEAARIQEKFNVAWQMADVVLARSVIK